MTNKPESSAVEAVAYRYRPVGWGVIGDWRVAPVELAHLIVSDNRYEYEALVPVSALDALLGEVERLRAIESAARTYYREYCQDEAGDEPDDNGRGMWTGASAKQINDAAALRDALTKESP